jgi:hypothetical protein
MNANGVAILLTPVFSQDRILFPDSNERVGDYVMCNERGCKSRLLGPLSSGIAASFVAALSFAFAFSPAALASDSGQRADIVVTFVAGNVSVSQATAVTSIRVGSKLALPASIRTGGDGTIELRQNRTTVTIAANSALEIPVTGLSSGKIDRVIQSSGSVFYRVEPRETQKLRVETPYLVAVIKGTQFNVVVQPVSATVALFEGMLQIDSLDATDTVELSAGQIAIRQGVEQRIRVLQMNTGETLRAKLSTAAQEVQSVDVDASAAKPSPSATGSAGEAGPNVDTIAATESGAVQTRSPVGMDVTDATITNVRESTPSAGTQIGVANVRADGLATANVAAGINPGPTPGSAAILAGGSSIGAGLNTAVAAGANVNVGTTVAGTASVAAGLNTAAAASASVNAASSAVGLATNIGATLGVGSASVATGPTVDVGTGSISAGTSASASVALPSATTTPNASVAAGVDVGTSVIGASVSLGGATLGVSVPLDAGIVGNTTTPTSGTAATTGSNETTTPTPIALPIAPAPSAGENSGGIIGRLRLPSGNR